MFLKTVILQQVIGKVPLYSQRYKTDFEVHTVPAYNTVKYVFSIFAAIIIAVSLCLAIKIALFVSI